MSRKKRSGDNTDPGIIRDPGGMIQSRDKEKEDISIRVKYILKHYTIPEVMSASNMFSLSYLNKVDHHLLDELPPDLFTEANQNSLSAILGSPPCKGKGSNFVSFNCLLQPQITRSYLLFKSDPSFRDMVISRVFQVETSYPVLTYNDEMKKRLAVALASSIQTYVSEVYPLLDYVSLEHLRDDFKKRRQILSTTPSLDWYTLRNQSQTRQQEKKLDLNLFL